VSRRLIVYKLRLRLFVNSLRYDLGRVTKIAGFKKISSTICNYITIKQVFLLSFILTSMLSTAGAQWYSIGCGGGGAMYKPRISPHSNAILTVSCDMGGYYISKDGGKSWAMIDLFSHAFVSEFDPVDPNVIYAGSDNLYKSKDLGKTWENICSENTRGKDNPLELIIDPDNTNNLYMAAGNREVIYLARSLNSFIVSKDGGSTWKKITSSIPRGEKLFGFVLDKNSPVERRAMYLGTSRGVFKSEDGGNSFSSHNQGLSKPELISFSGGSDIRNGKTILYACVENDGIYKSEDGAQTWVLTDAPESEKYIISACDNYPYVAYTGLKDEIYKTQDSGVTWESVMFPDNMGDCWISSVYSWGWHFSPLMGIKASANDPNAASFTTFGGNFLTLDGGTTWKGLYSKAIGNDYWASNGLEVTNCFGVHFDPSNKNVLYITYTDAGLWKSLDKGKTWKNISSDIPVYRGCVFWMEIDPDNANKLYAVTSKINSLPEDGPLRQVDAGRGGFVISEDGGETWVKAMDGLPDAPMCCVLVDPNSPADKRVVYVAVMGKGVFKSTDGGYTWIEKNNGLGPNLNAWRMIYSKGKLYLVVTQSKKSMAGGALYCSVDNGNTWKKVNESRNLAYILDVAIHPKNSEIIYMCGYKGYNGGTPSPGGVYRSDDAGKTWKRILEKDYIYGLTVDKRSPDLLYATYCEDEDYPKDRGIFISKNRGNTWSKLEGIPFSKPHRVILDPNDVDHLYVTTFGGGVFTNKDAYAAPMRAPVLKAGQSQKSAVCQKTAETITIDGKLDEAIWKNVKPIEDFILLSGEIPKQKTSVYTAYDSQNFYIAFVCTENKLDSIANTYPKTAIDADLWEDDSVELFIDASPQSLYYYHLIVNTNGSICSVKHNKNRNKMSINDKSWNPQAKAAALVNKSGQKYTVEIAIPLKDLGVTVSIKPNFKATFNAARNRTADNESFTWSLLSIKKGFNDPDRFGKLTFK